MSQQKKTYPFRPEDESLLKRLRQAAEKESRSINNLMNKYLKERLDEEEKQAG